MGSRAPETTDFFAAFSDGPGLWAIAAAQSSACAVKPSAEKRR
jgi:hypothetical protein